MTDQTQRDIGVVQGTLLAHGQRLAAIEEDLKTVVNWINQQRGSKKTLTILLTTAGAFGAGFAETIHWLLGAHK